MKKLLYISVALLLAACHKDDPTPSGANTFSCQIDGQDFTPYLAPVLITPQKALQANRTNYQGGIFIHARNSYNELELYVGKSNYSGTHRLSYARVPMPYNTNPNSYAYYESIPALQPGQDPYNPPPTSKYYTDNTNVGTITFTRFDTVAHVAGGTFEYTAREAATGKLVHVTNGKFDVKF